MGTTQSGTQTTTTTAPGFQLPYQNYFLNQAYSQYQNQNPQNLVAPFAPQQETALQGITNLGGNMTPTGQAAANYTQGILNHGPTQNPYLDATFNQAAQRTQSQLASEFAGAGRNVDQSAGLRGQQLNDLATQIYGGAYNTGVQQQMGAAAEAPALDQLQYQDLNNLYNAGGQVQNLANQYIQAPQAALNQLGARVTGNLGSATSTPLYQNNAANGLGGALIGSQIGGLINSQYGGTVGGLLGGLVGAFGG